MVGFTCPEELSEFSFLQDFCRAYREDLKNTHENSPFKCGCVGGLRKSQVCVYTYNVLKCWNLHDSPTALIIFDALLL